MEQPDIDAVVFDIGGVLLDWNPRYLYRRMFDDESEMEQFLAQVCTLEWHAAHDRGVPFAESCAALAEHHPEYREAIMAWGERSAEMDRGEIAGSVAVLRDLLDTGMPVYALTNMEQETYPRRVARFPFMSWFGGTVVSYAEGVAKPDPEIFRRLLARFALQPGRTLMIDDSQANLRIATSLGLQTLHYRTPELLRESLLALGLLAA